MQKEVFRNFDESMYEKYIPNDLSWFAFANVIKTCIIPYRKSLIDEGYKALSRLKGNRYYEIRYMQRIHSNNWLRMHGYPMKRKGSQK